MKLLKIEEPETAWVVPLSVTVPELWVKVPELAQLPATLILADNGAVRAPEIVKLLNELVELPEIAVVPLKVAVPERGVKVPELAQFPPTVTP